ncbi:hypothetical protein KPG71_08855 [Roseovarius sp. PS-C2]|uniref:hypothetical protein n=1 Tax=Roseovarius sp. PS-C2 TaxID=2820814 RepID=UPI001C0BD927|nr:hypothetical protein [Roseovarius sp. PS-C2]MBU3260117.1 hypothetical protein [Roseovarius sp. PS-C2]
MNKLITLLFKKALIRSLNKKAPSRFRYSVENDFYSIVIKKQGDEYGILVDSMNPTTIKGRLWTGSRYQIPASISFDRLQKPILEVTRFYGFEQIRYSGLWDFWCGEIFQLPFLHWLASTVKQKFFEATTRFRHSRMDVLKKLVEKHLDTAVRQNGLLFEANQKSIIQMFSDCYGARVFAHSAYSAESAHFRLIIESLAETGDLNKKNRHEFELSPKALATIAEYEQAERRHKDNIRLNWLIAVLTLVIAASTALQGWQAFQLLNEATPSPKLDQTSR